MTLAFVPIPATHLSVTQRVWRPFVEKIAERTREHVPQMIAMMEAGTIGVGVAWHVEERKAKALIGFKTVVRGDESVAEIIWLTGSERETWEPLVDDVEQFFRDHHGCAAVRAIARPGWSRLFRARGYRMTHVVIERELV